jgi:hypothetical protein
MFFIALGFALAFGLPIVLIVVLVVDSSAVAAAVALLSEVSTLAGLGCILYALRL